MSTPFADAAVAAILATYPDDVRSRVMAVRALIFDTAERIPAIGPLTETLRWGQPSYLTTAPRTGTTIRLGHHRLKPHPFPAR
jgi:hypothetical protein